MLVNPVDLPAESAIAGIYEPVHLADAFAVQLPPGASSDPELLAAFMLSSQPRWIGMLTRIRDVVVSPFGLKTARQLAVLPADAQAKRIGIFRVYSTGKDELVLGEDDSHLDFRISLLCSAPAAPRHGRTLTVSTVVQCHNLLGRAYIFVIAPFHRRVVQASLRRAAHLGWPTAAN